jgi:hypothetical protein
MPNRQPAKLRMHGSSWFVTESDRNTGMKGHAPSIYMCLFEFPGTNIRPDWTARLLSRREQRHIHVASFYGWRELPKSVDFLHRFITQLST